MGLIHAVRAAGGDTRVIFLISVGVILLGSLVQSVGLRACPAGMPEHWPPAPRPVRHRWWQRRVH